MAVASAQENTAAAAVLTVTQAGAEVRRVETEAWISVGEGAVMAFGEGDRVRTNETGRVLIDFADSAQLLVPPKAQWKIVELQQQNDGVLLTSFLERGEVILRADGGTFTDVSIATPGTAARATNLTEPLHMLVKRGQGDNKTFLLLAEGNGGLQGETTFADIFANDAIVAQLPPGSVDIVSARQQPFSPAHIEGVLAGCPAAVITQSGENLNARQGPSVGNRLYGQFPNEAEVQVMGVVASGGWYRVQYKSGFGWVERLAVTLDDPDCALPTLPDDSFDTPTRVIDPTPLELSLLQPFYGTPEYDPIFYVFAPQP